MNALATNIDDGGTPRQPQYCLRQRDSDAFWDGIGWSAGMTAARAFLDLDHALSVAQRIGTRALDLLVLFPSHAHSLIIPLARSREAGAI